MPQADRPVVKQEETLKRVSAEWYDELADLVEGDEAEEMFGTLALRWRTAPLQVYGQTDPTNTP